MKRNVSASIVFGIKLLITIALIAYLLRKVDVGPVLMQIRTIQATSAVLAVAVMLLQLALVSVRWQLVNRLVEAPTDIRQVFRLTLIGQFFNQVLPSAMGGDAVRAWLASREGVPLARAVTGILCDRAVGLVVLLLVISCTFFVLPSLTSHGFAGSHAFRIIALVGLTGLAALLILGASVAKWLMYFRITRSIGELVRDLRKVLYTPSTSAVIVALGVAVQFLVVIAIYVCARGLDIHLDFVAALLTVPAIMLVSTVPISFAGWGVREGAMVFGLGLVGIAATQALAVSVTFGLLQIVVGLPGGALWLTRSGAARTHENALEHGTQRTSSNAK